GAAGGARQEKPPEGAGRPNRPPPRWRGGTGRPPWDAGVTTATALTPSRSTCVACVPFGGGGTRRSSNASCRCSVSRVIAGPILRLTNQRSPRRTSSARRLIAAPLRSVGYRQEAHCHDCCPRSSSRVSPTSVFPNSSCSFVATSLNLARIVDAGRQRGNTLRCESYPIPMPRAKKPPQLSAKERALLNRLDHLSEKEIKRLTTREIFAYFKLIDRVDSRTDIRRMVERAKWRHK